MATQLFMKHLNTILLTIIGLILLYGVSSVRTLAKAQTNMQIEIAVIGKAFLDHNDEADYWKELIGKNTDEVTDLKLGNVQATADRITRKEALEAIDQLRRYVEKTYQRK